MPSYSDELEALTRSLTDAYRLAWARVKAEEATVLAGLALNPRLWRRRARLAEISERIAEDMSNLDALAASWVSREFPRFYEAGAAAAAQTLGSPFGWTLPHREALALHARDLYDDLLEATAHINTDTKRLIREVTRTEVLADQIIGKTARQTARNVTRYLASRGITAVTYANGRRVGLDTYAEMAVRTKTAVAYNMGTFNQGAEFGVKFYEVFDGPSCGWTSHDDPDLANGKIVPVAAAQNYPISHPNCARSFGPRPDLISAPQAAKAEPTAGGQPLRTEAARQETIARRTAAGMTARPRTPQRVLERRANLLQRIPRALAPSRLVPISRRPPGPTPPGPPGPGAGPQPPTPGPPEELVEEALPQWRRDYDDLQSSKPTWTHGMDAADAAGQPTAASYAQEEWARRVGKVLDDEVNARVDADLARRAAEGTLPDLDALTAAVDEAKAAYSAIPKPVTKWDDIAQELFGKPSFTDLDSAEKSLLFRETDKRAKAWQKLRDAARARISDAEAALESAKNVRLTTYRTHARAILNELRPMADGHRDTFRWTTHPKQGAKAKQAKETLDFASSFYPQEWVDRINANRQVRTGYIKRGHEADYRSYLEIMLSTGQKGNLLPGDPTDLSVALHELGHGMESVDPRLRALEHAFHHRRTTDFSQVVTTVFDAKANDYIPVYKQEGTSRIYKGPKEVGRRDKWAEHYSGKVYGGGPGPLKYWEHFSTGIEGIFTGRHGIPDDADYRHWMLGILASL